MGIFLRTGNPVDCVAANNDDMALGGLAAFEDAGVSTDSVLFLGVDASEAGCQAILEGKMDFTGLFRPRYLRRWRRRDAWQKASLRTQ